MNLAGNRFALRAFVAFGVSLVVTTAAPAGQVAVAVAANFLEPLRALEAPFHERTSHDVDPSPGSSGELHAEIVNGAPFDVFLSADSSRPRSLEENGLAVPGSRFSYAIGRLVLWSADEQRPGETLTEALTSDFRHLAVANPKTAPYGAAAMQVLERLGLEPLVGPRIVQGGSIGQTFQFVRTGNAELGFVARSQLSGPGRPTSGKPWDVSASLHEPILQDAVLLRRAAKSEAAEAFIRFLRSDEARATIRAFGYDVPVPPSS